MNPENFSNVVYTLDKCKELHPTAQSIHQILDYELFLIEYSGLVIVVAFQYLVAFYHDNDWHISTEKSSPRMRRYKNALKELFIFTKWYNKRADMLRELQQLLNRSQNETLNSDNIISNNK